MLLHVGIDDRSRIFNTDRITWNDHLVFYTLSDASQQLVLIGNDDVAYTVFKSRHRCPSALVQGLHIAVHIDQELLGCGGTFLPLTFGHLEPGTIERINIPLCSS
ncbi:hypothetical protein D1872_257150 [compost metagenome]